MVQGDKSSSHCPAKLRLSISRMLKSVLIATDQFNFMVHHEVHVKQTDSGVTKDLADSLTNKFSNQMAFLSLDKGFYSIVNKQYVDTLSLLQLCLKRLSQTKKNRPQDLKNCARLIVLWKQILIN